MAPGVAGFDRRVSVLALLVPHALDAVTDKLNKENAELRLAVMLLVPCPDATVPLTLLNDQL